MRVLSSLSLLFFYQSFIGVAAFERSNVGKYSLFDESRVNKMCAENDVKQRSWFMKQFSCLTVWIDFYGEQSHRTLHESCWMNHTQMQYPGKDEKKWFDFLCRTITPAILMNSVHHCFLRNITENGSKTQDQVTQRYIQCSSVDMKMRIRAIDVKLQAFTLTDPESREPEESKRKVLCVEKPDANASRLVLNSLKCFEKAYPDQSEMMKRCWSLLFTGQYPSSESGWLKFYCSDKHPYVSVNLMEECVRRHRYKELSSWPESCEGPEAFTLNPLGDFVTRAEEKIAASIREDICIKSDRSAVDAFIKGFALYPITKVILAFKKNAAGLDYCYNSYLGVATPKSDKEYVERLCSVPSPTWREKNGDVLSCVARIYLPANPSLSPEEDADARFYSQISKAFEESSYDENSRFEGSDDEEE